LLSGIFLLYLFRFEPPFDTWGLMLRRFFSWHIVFFKQVFREF
jgi:hypothetical protein